MYSRIFELTILSLFYVYSVCLMISQPTRQLYTCVRHFTAKTYFAWKPQPFYFNEHVLLCLWILRLQFSTSVLSQWWLDPNLSWKPFLFFRFYALVSGSCRHHYCCLFCKSSSCFSFILSIFVWCGVLESPLKGMTYNLTCSFGFISIISGRCGQQWNHWLHRIHCCYIASQ